MAKKVTGFPRDPKRCYAYRHMSPGEFVVYNVMVAYATTARHSREGDEVKGPLLFESAIRPALCNATNLPENTVTRHRDRLKSLGWLIEVQKKKRKSDGKWQPAVYRVLTHEEFIATHPDSCPGDSYADFGTAGQYKVKVGARFPKGKAPANFLFEGPVVPFVGDLEGLIKNFDVLHDYLAQVPEKKAAHIRRQILRTNFRGTSHPPILGNEPSPKNGVGHPPECESAIPQSGGGYCSTHYRTDCRSNSNSPPNAAADAVVVSL